MHEEHTCVNIVKIVYMGVFEKVFCLF